jgi:hypothetical protein
MKTTIFLLAIVLLGILLGIGVTVLRIGVAPWNPEPVVVGENKKATPPRVGSKAKVEVKSPEYDFGSLDIASSGSHDFVLSNCGEERLTLRVGATTCRCAMSKLEQEEIPPGGSAKVTLSWKPTEKIGTYRQSAEILTNDPAHSKVTLTVAGRYTATAHIAPADLVFSEISTTETATADVRLLCYLDKPMQITGHQWTDAATAGQFDVSMKPLSAEDLKEWTAKSGMLATVSVKRGLTPGRFRQKLVFRTNLERTPTLELPIQGIVGSEIAIAGPGWDPDTALLTLGVVSSKVGLKWRLFLVIHGAARKEVTFKAAHVVPDCLKVRFGPRSEINGKVVQMPLLIEVPPDSPMVNHLGSERGNLGEILLETTHPHVPKMRILVRMAIKE